MHGNRFTDFAAAICAGHLHDLRGTAPADALASAAGAGLTVTPASCALLGVLPGEVEARLEAGRS